MVKNFDMILPVCVFLYQSEPKFRLYRHKYRLYLYRLYIYIYIYIYDLFEFK